jgi:release factor glutamine methyltransferase
LDLTFALPVCGQVGSECQIRSTSLSVDAARRALSRAFRDHGLESPDLDARLLTAHALGLDHSQLAAAATRDLTRSEVDKVNRAAARRLSREPVARILGRKEFWNLTLTITEAVLVPRPETETIVEVALEVIAARGLRSGAIRILDLGTGSGALLLALLSELPNAFGVGTDLDVDALVVARDNAARFGVGRRAVFVAGNYGDAVAGGFDLVVANPPYVATNDVATLAPEVRDYDPILALDGGADGLHAYRAIADVADRLLLREAHLVVEIGIGQGAAVSALFAAAGLDIRPGVRRDLAGIPRALSAKKFP